MQAAAHSAAEDFAQQVERLRLAIMAVALALANEMHFIVASILTSLLYLVVLAGFVYIACRGSIGLRERFLVPLKER